MAFALFAGLAGGLVLLGAVGCWSGWCLCLFGWWCALGFHFQVLFALGLLFLVCFRVSLSSLAGSLLLCLVSFRVSLDSFWMPAGWVCVAWVAFRVVFGFAFQAWQVLLQPVDGH